MPRRGSAGRKIALGMGGTLLVALAALYVVGHLVTDGRIPRGTTVAGVDIGGLQQRAAEQQLARQLPWADGTPVTVVLDGTPHRIAPGRSGLGIDLRETVSRAGVGGTWNPVTMIERLSGDTDVIEPVLTVDEAVLRASLGELTPQAHREPRQPSVRLTDTGEVRVRHPRTGRSLDLDTTVDRVVARHRPRGAVRVLAATSVVQPRTTAAELRSGLAELVRPVTSGPVVVRSPGRRITLGVDDLAPALAFRTTDTGLRLAVDVRLLRDAVDDVIGSTGREARDATVVLRGGRPQVVPGRRGAQPDVAQVMDGLPDALRSSDDRTITVDNTGVAPEVTTAEARGWGITEPVSHFSTQFPHAEYRNTNQSRAAELISGTVLAPGETFSFNDTVGERTAENGFVPGYMISGGVYAEDYGGGVSQVVTTTYNAAFFAGLQDIEHKPHSFYIDRYPMGREATVAWPTLDLKFRNNTRHGVLIEAWVVPSTTSSEGEMHVRLWSTKTWDIESDISEPYDYTEPTTLYLDDSGCVPTTGYSGFDVDVERIFRRPGSDEIVKTETQHVTYTPADTVVCQ